MALQGFSAGKAYPLVPLRTRLLSQTSRSALSFAIGMAAFAGSAIFFAPDALAACTAGSPGPFNYQVQCGTTVTTDTTDPAGTPNDRHYQISSLYPFGSLIIDPGAVVSGYGLAISTDPVLGGGINITNGGTISVDSGKTPTAGGTAALSVEARSTITYSGGGSIINNGVGDAFSVKQTGTGTTDINATGMITAANGSGVVVRDTATGGSIDVTTGAVTTLGGLGIGIDVLSTSTAAGADLTIVANGDIHARTAILGQITVTGASGNIDITANGTVDAISGIYASSLGAGLVTVTANGPITTTLGAGVYAFGRGGDVTVTTGAVTSTSNTAIYANQDKFFGGNIHVTANGDISGKSGIDATKIGLGKVTVIANGSVVGTSLEGINAIGSLGVDVQVADTVTGATRGLTAIGGSTFGGNISVTGTGGFVGGSDDAANIRNDGHGTVTVNISGASSSTSGNGIYVRDNAASGDIAVTTGAVTAMSAGRDGISVMSVATAADVTIVANGDVKAGENGIIGGNFSGTGTGNVDITANGAIDAETGVFAQANSTGTMTVKTVGPVTATTGKGIHARSSSGNVLVTTGAVTSTGDTAIFASEADPAGAGTVGVTANGKVLGTTGIEARSSGSGAIRVTANGAVIGTVAEGIKATGNGAVDVQVANTVAGTTRGLGLIGGTGGTGNISVTGTGGFVGGSGDGANIQNNGAGTVTVNISGASSSTSGNGIVVRDTNSGSHIGVATGAVTALAAGQNAIDVNSVSTTGNVTIVANGDVKAGGVGIAGGIALLSGTGNVDITANSAINAEFGISAYNLGTGSTTVKAVGPITTTDYGVFAQSSGGNISVTAGAVTSASGTAITAQLEELVSAGTINVTANGNVSGTTGIKAANFGTGVIGVIANGTVTGTSAEGILATGNGAVGVQVASTVTGATRGLSLTGGTSGSGNISVTGTGGFVGGSGNAANIQNDGSGTVTVDISGASGSTSSDGIVVRDTATGGNIAVTTGDVAALAFGKNGIDVLSQSTTANVTIVTNGLVEASGTGIAGRILQNAATGNVDITANGAIDAGYGIAAQNNGTGSTVVRALGPVTARGDGVYAFSRDGDVSVTAGAVTATNGVGIIATQAGTGMIDVTANGDVSGATGISVLSYGTAAARVIANGVVTGTADEGIGARGYAAVDVQVAGTVMGAKRGLRLFGDTGTISIASSGAILNLSGLSTDEAIAAHAVAATLTNAGSIVGTVQFTGGVTLFANNGSWNSAGGSSDFGTGTLVSGGTAVGANAAGIAETTQWANLVQFTNQGLLTMVDGGVGDMVRQTGGNATLAAGGTLAIDIDAAGQADRFSTSGTATIAGSTLRVSALGGIAAPGTRYTVLTADAGLTGQFAALTGAVKIAFLELVDAYDANNAYLDVLKYRNFTDAALTPNQIATAGALESLPTSGSLYNAILNLSTDAVARDAFDQLSGEVYPSAQTALVEDSHLVRDAATNRIRAAFGAVGASTAPVMAYADQAYGGAAVASLDPTMTAAVAPDTDRFALWSQGFGSWGHTGSDGNAARLNRSTGGFLAGGDAAVFDTWRLGIMAGYSRTNFNVKDRASSGSSDNYHLGLYGGTSWNVGGGTLGLRTGASYTWHDIAMSRSVTFPGFSDSLKADYRAGTTQVFGELGYGMRAGNFGFEPFANLAYVNLRTDGFTENGGAAALTSASATTDATFTTLGLHASTDFTLGEMAATARGTLGWRHAFGDTKPLSSFAFAGGSPFTIAGVPIARDALVLDIGLDIAITPNATLGISYGGQFGGSASDQSVKGNLAIRF